MSELSTFRRGHSAASAYEIRGGGGRQIWPPFGPGVTWGSENRPRSSFWAGWAAGTAGGAGRGGAGVLWRCVRCAEGWG